MDSTTASGYWEVTEDGLFQLGFGHGEDHRPDLPQLTVMLATLDPLGMPVAVDVLPGQRSDDPLYRPINRATFEQGQKQLALAMLLLALTVLLMHRDNIRRLLAGTEPRIGSKS